MNRLRLNAMHYLAFGSIVVVIALAALLFRGSGRGGPAKGELFVYCGATARKPLEEVAADYEARYGVVIRPQYGGSAALLSQIEVSETGDLYLAGDVSHLNIARKKGLADESLPLASLEPVLVVAKGNPMGIHSVDDLTKPSVRIALGDPETPEIGRLTKRLLTASGHWETVKQQVTHRGVFKPTEPDVAIDVQSGSVDAGIIWKATAQRIKEVEIVPLAELQGGRSLMSIGVLSRSSDPTGALHFARYLAAADRGLEAFGRWGFDTVDGDAWADRPKLTVFAGSVNRRALAPILKRFEQREGVEINTVYNACGFLTAQMRGIEKTKDAGFPDVYMACDVSYLEPVNELFEDAVNVSNTDIVICVAEGNPKRIASLDDLLQEGVRVSLGEPQNVTLGVLTKRLLESKGLYEKLLATGNVVKHATSSAHLVPDVVTGSVDVSIAYRSDTLAERDKVDVVLIDSPLAKAVQPFTIARCSPYKHLCRRLLQTIARSRADYEAAGFNFEMAP